MKLALPPWITCPHALCLKAKRCRALAGPLSGHSASHMLNRNSNLPAVLFLNGGDGENIRLRKPGRKGLANQNLAGRGWSWTVVWCGQALFTAKAQP